MRYVSKKEWAEAQNAGWTGTYFDYDGSHPDWVKKRTFMSGDNGPGTTLYIEGESFEIVENNDPRCPKKFQVAFYSGWRVTDPMIQCFYKYFRSEEEGKNWAVNNMPSKTSGFRVCLVGV